MISRISRIALSILAGVALGGALPLMAQHESHGSSHGGKHSSPKVQPKMSAGSQKMHHLMVQDAKSMLHGGMKMTGDADRDFARMMIEHHKSGVRMAKAYLPHAKNPTLKKLAQSIIREQNREIEIMAKHD